MENNLTPLLTITARVCQSCGLPMPDGELFGTHGDGHPCTEYCRNCFQNGLFTAASLEEVRKSIAVSGRNDVPDLSTLKRWMPAGQQASWILTQCGALEKQPKSRNLLCPRSRQRDLDRNCRSHYRQEYQVRLLERLHEPLLPARPGRSGILHPLLSFPGSDIVDRPKFQ